VSRPRPHRTAPPSTTPTPQTQLPTWTELQRASWRLPPALTVSEWADEHRVLGAMTDRPGRWSSAFTPYAREWVDSSRVRHVRQVTVCASTQVGKTEAANNLLAFHVCEAPAPIMFVTARDVDVRTTYKARLLPMIEACRPLRAELTDSPHDVTRREIAFRRAILYLRAAQSPMELASVPCRIVIGDECDKWPRWTGREAAPLELARERTRTFADHFIYVSSTPTTRAGVIHAEFEAGDRRRFFVPCPLCGNEQVLRWANVDWDRAAITDARAMERERAAWYRCAGCGGRIEDRHKALMLAQGTWVPEGSTPAEWRAAGAAADRAAHRSYHLWAGYSPWLAWWQLAHQWLRSFDDPARLQNFVNAWLAELWEERVDEASAEAVESCVDDKLEMGKPPQDVRVVCAAVDVQKDYLVWGVGGWGVDDEFWLVAAGRCGTFAELEDVLFRNVWGPRQLALRCVLIDSRARRDEVLDFCRRHRPAARPIAGVERESPVPFGTRKLDRHPRTGAPLEESVIIWTVHVAWFKDLWAAALQRTAKKESRAGTVHLPADLPDDLRGQLSAEHKVRLRSGNKEVARWVLRPGHRRNEMFDVATYLFAAGRMVRVDLLRSPPPPGSAPPPGPPARRPTRPPRPGGGWNTFPRLGPG
jgi:phage terminase large subunit GpA-like protein